MCIQESLKVEAQIDSGDKDTHNTRSLAGIHCRRVAKHWSGHSWSKVGSSGCHPVGRMRQSLIAVERVLKRFTRT